MNATGCNVCRYTIPVSPRSVSPQLTTGGTVEPSMRRERRIPFDPEGGWGGRRFPRTAPTPTSGSSSVPAAEHPEDRESDHHDDRHPSARALEAPTLRRDPRRWGDHPGRRSERERVAPGRRSGGEAVVAPPRPLVELGQERPHRPEQPRPGRRVERGRAAGRVEEQPVVDDLDVELRGVVDEARHDVGREEVERVLLVALRAVQGEVLVEVALERQALCPLERGRQVGAEAVVALRVEHDVRQGHIQLHGHIAPAIRRRVLPGLHRVLVVAELHEPWIHAADQVGGQARAAEMEDHPGERRIVHARLVRHAVGLGEPVQAIPGGARVADAHPDEYAHPRGHQQEEHEGDRRRGGGAAARCQRHHHGREDREQHDPGDRDGHDGDDRRHRHAGRPPGPELRREGADGGRVDRIGEGARIERRRRLRRRHRLTSSASHVRSAPSRKAFASRHRADEVGRARHDRGVVVDLRHHRPGAVLRPEDVRALGGGREAVFLADPVAPRHAEHPVRVPEDSGTPGEQHVVAPGELQPGPFGDLAREDAVLPGGLSEDVVEGVVRAAVEHRLMVRVFAEREEDTGRPVSEEADQTAESLPERDDPVVRCRGVGGEVPGQDRHEVAVERALHRRRELAAVRSDAGPPVGVDGSAHDPVPLRLCVHRRAEGGGGVRPADAHVGIRRRGTLPHRGGMEDPGVRGEAAGDDRVHAAQAVVEGLPQPRADAGVCDPLHATTVPAASDDASRGRRSPIIER
ncbi:unnamed protein product [Penicillium discolor]